MELAKVNVRENRLTVDKLRINVAGTIGATVAFEYDDLWNSMDSKTLVWRAGTVTKADITASGIVPAEVMERPGRELFVGVYGTKGNTATPTLWADLGYIYDGADPSGDVTTAPSLPVWAQLENRVSDLEGEGLSAAVADYLEKNPVEAGATTEEAAQIKQNAENIKKLSDDKLDASKLPEAVNDALAQAKESGEFKGEHGKTPEKGKDYFTPAEVQAIAEQAAELVEIPEEDVDLTGYATEEWVGKNYQPKGNYLTDVPNYYAKKSELPTKVSQLENDKGYLTEHQDLSGYAKTTDIPTDDHINGLINTALGVIENGSY